jgi:hypothetical protein
MIGRAKEIKKLKTIDFRLKYDLLAQGQGKCLEQEI